MIDWVRDLHHQGGSAFAVAAGRLIVHERRTRLVALDLADGAVLWDVPVGTWPRAVVVSGDRCLVIPQSADRLLCLDIATGDTVWSADVAPFTGHVVCAAGAVLVGGWRRYTTLRAFDLATGRLRWTSDTTSVRPGGTDRGFLVGEEGGTVVRLLDPHDGRESARWEVPLPLTGDIRVEGGHVVARCGTSSLVEIGDPSREIARVDGVLLDHEHVGGALWLRQRTGWVGVEEPGRTAPGVVAVGDDVLIADLDDGVRRVDAEGRTVGRGRMPTRRIRRLVAVDRERFLVVGKGNVIIARSGDVRRG